MKNIPLRRTGSALAIVALISTTIAAPAFAQTSYDRYQSSSRSTTDYRYSTRGLSSTARRAIDKLDDDPVKNIPIPVLFNVSTSNISPNFGDPRDGGSRSHEGEDIMAVTGNYIVSPTEAVVTSIGSGSSAGKYVYTANPGGERFVYMHLDRYAEDLKVGTILEVGDLIGYVGDTGSAKGAPHLHFEIREGREALDPFPRLTKEFTLADRVEFTTRALKNADDEEEEAEDVVAIARGTFIAARAQGMKLPESITDELGTAAAAIPSFFSRDLTLGSQGADVTALQEILISANSGTAATTLAHAGATGYFGPVTQAALAEYQTAKGISPASGYFGSLTRARISASI